MNKQNLYVAFFNALLGVVMSLLLKGSVLIYVLIFIMILTILFIERQWIYEKVFRRKKARAILGYLVILTTLSGFLFLVTRPNRDTANIISTTQHFLNHLRPGQYEQAYLVLTENSKAQYRKEDFVNDHDLFHIQIQDFQIDEIRLNEFDSKKAVVKVSSPFALYGKTTMNLDLVKELEGWRITFSPRMLERDGIVAEKKGVENTPPVQEKRKPGAVTRFFRKLF
ncbi:MAG: hypothetical protein JNK65_06975 [Deltaproteobacteria bacterium]|nr:hypothetical protein [Deltaproteobacteria bacterium]